MLKALAPGDFAADGALVKQWDRALARLSYLHPQTYKKVASSEEYTRLKRQLQTCADPQPVNRNGPRQQDSAAAQRADVIAYVAIEDYDHFVRVWMVRLLHPPSSTLVGLADLACMSGDVSGSMRALSPCLFLRSASSMAKARSLGCRSDTEDGASRVRRQAKTNQVISAVVPSRERAHCGTGARRGHVWMSRVSKPTRTLLRMKVMAVSSAIASCVWQVRVWQTHLRTHVSCVPRCSR